MAGSFDVIPWERLGIFCVSASVSKRAVKRLNPWALKNSRTVLGSKLATANDCSGRGTSTSVFNVTKSRLMRAISEKFIKFSFLFGCVISLARARRESKSPYSVIS